MRKGMVARQLAWTYWEVQSRISRVNGCARAERCAHVATSRFLMSGGPRKEDHQKNIDTRKS